jgi:hypothetical protein
LDLLIVRKHVYNCKDLFRAAENIHVARNVHGNMRAQNTAGMSRRKSVAIEGRLVSSTNGQLKIPSLPLP